MILAAMFAAMALSGIILKGEIPPPDGTDTPAGPQGGFGTQTRGGLDGRVVRVTNLEDWLESFRRGVE
jgi:hypothetical protein